MIHGTPIVMSAKESSRPSMVQSLTSGPWLPLLLAVVTFLAYAPSLKSDLVYDAHIEIVEEGFITTISNLPAVLSLKVLGMNIMLGRRPGHLLYLMLLASVCGKTPFGYHLASNFLHATNVALLFVFLRRLVASEPVGLTRDYGLKVQLALVAVTLIFALHPLATETVSGVSFSSDLLVTFFTLLVLLAATAFRPENLRATRFIGAGGVFCAFAAVTCKESGLAAALLLIVYWFLFRRQEATGPWLWFLGAATMVTIAFLALRFRFNPPGEVSDHHLGGSFSQVLWIQPCLWVFMMGKLVWPVHLSADYTLMNVSWIPSPLALAILVLVVVLQLWLVSRSRIGGLGVAFYWLGLATVSNFIPLQRILADRFYYMSLAGVSLQLLALLLLARKSSRNFQAGLAFLFLAVPPLTVLNLTRQDVFANEISLWTDTLRVSPNSRPAHFNLGSVYLRVGQFDEATTQFQAAVALDPGSAQIHYDLGLALSHRGQLDEAMAQFQKAIQIDPQFAGTHNHLGSILLQKGKSDEAMVEYQKALALDPHSAPAHYNLGMAFSEKGQVDAALAQFQTAVALDASDAEAHNNLGMTLAQKGRLDEALVQFRNAVAIDPANAEAEENLGNVLLQKGAVDEAISRYQRAVQINPADAGNHNILGIALAQKGRINEAITQFQEALRLKPDLSEAQNNLARVQALQNSAPAQK